MKLKLPTYFSQKDSRWKDKKLGTSTVCTIGSDGCLLCCVTAVLKYHDKDTSPDRLNDDITRVKGWYKACRLIYGAITDIYSDVSVAWDNYIDCADYPAPLEKIDKILESKRIPIVKVDYKPETAKLDEHWVCIIGKENDNYLIYDPIDGSEQWFQNRYQEPGRYIFKIVTYNGEIKEEENVKDEVSDLEDKVKSLEEGLATKSLECNTLRDNLAKQERDNKDLVKQIVEARNQRDTISREKKDLERVVEKQKKELKAVEKDADVLGAIVNDLRDALAASVEAKIQAMSLFELLKVKYFDKGGENK